MLFLINTITSYADVILKSYSRGRIHSIYRKTVNLQIGPHLLALQAPDSPVSPISLVTESNPGLIHNLGLQAGQAIELSHRELSLCALGSVIHFQYAGADVFDSKLSQCSPPISVKLLESALALSDVGGFRSLFFMDVWQELSQNDPFFIMDAARRHLLACAASIQAGNYGSAAKEMVRLMGLGIGLTPSGDDFLCGVMAGLTLSGNLSHPFSVMLREEIARNLQNTNDISRAFLLCALASHFSRPVKQLPYATTPETIVAAFEAIGHSSGIDTLCGIYYSLSVPLL